MQYLSPKKLGYPRQISKDAETLENTVVATLGSGNGLKKYILCNIICELSVTLK